MGSKGAVPRGTELDAGCRVRARKKTSRSWTKSKEVKFLSALADSCNVKFAARKASVSTSAIYERRKNNASFRAGWKTALREGYAKLELILLERALVGTEKVIERRDGSIERMREYSNSLAVALLRLHRDEVAEPDIEPTSPQGVNEREVDEIRQRIARKLERLNRQLTGKSRSGADGEQGADS